jgi:hypothetical protein
MTNYFRLGDSTDESQVGSTFPQSQTELIKDVNDPRNLSKLEPGKPIDQNIILPIPVIHQKAKLTDLISTVTIGFRLVISEKLKNILVKYVSSKEIEFIPFVIVNNNNELYYWLVNPINFKMDAVNYPVSEIWKTKFGYKKLERVENISDEKIFVEKNKLLRDSESYLSLKIGKVQFKDNITKDFFSLNFVDGAIGYYISEKLKNEIEEAGCTGIAFQQL